MTRLPPRRLLALALATAATAAAPTVYAQAANPFAMPAAAAPVAPAVDPQAFTVSDIRIDGLQRVPAGTVFTYLPVERGDRIDRTGVAEAIRALYGTGFFDDVRA
ncbi:MAG: outer membrane protein assembly factor BamA, partial [Pseudomonadota bacterium]|nr:outer membrane protein assembly factor BamA [Pseudomonadota bacterium]